MFRPGQIFGNITLGDKRRANMQSQKSETDGCLFQVQLHKQLKETVIAD